MEIGFTKFNAQLMIAYDRVSSVALDADYWRVVKGFRYYIGDKGSNSWVDVPLGYLTDGASVPRFLWGLIPPWGEYGQAAALHDYLCENPYHDTPDGKVTITRAQVDAILYEAMVVLGVSPWKLKTIKLGVDSYRYFSGGRTDVTNPLKIKLQTDPAEIAWFLKKLGS